MAVTRGQPPFDPALERQFRLWQSALADHGHVLPDGQPAAVATPFPPVQAPEPVLSVPTPIPTVKNFEPDLFIAGPAARPPAVNERKRSRRRRWPAAVFVGAILLAISAAGYREFGVRQAPVKPRAAARPPALPAWVRTPARTVPPPDESDRRATEQADNIAHAGEALALSGDAAGALRLYRQGLAIRRELAARRPDDGAVQRALAEAWDKVADAHAAQGDTVRATGAYREAETAWEHCARVLPEDRDVRRSGSLTALSLGNLLLARDDPAGAVEALQRGTSIQETLCRLEPDNTAWQEDLALGWLRLSDAFDQRGDDVAALQTCRRAVALDEALVEREPENLAWQGDLAVAHGKVGDLLLACNEIDPALREYNEAASGWEKLVAADASPERRRALVETKDQIGQALEEVKKQPDAAVPFYQQALGVVAGLSAENPADPLLASLHAVVCFHLGRAMTNCQPADRSTARAALHEARDRLTSLKSADGTYPYKEQAETLADVERLLAELGKEPATRRVGP